MMSEAGRDWRAIVLLVGGGGTGVLAVVVALSLFTNAAFDTWGNQHTTSPAAQMSSVIVSGALVLIGVILIVAAYHALKAIREMPAQPLGHAPMRAPTILVLLLVWLAASILGQAVVQPGGPTWLASPLHILAIGSPVYLWARLATAGLTGATKLRVWGAMAAGLVCATGISTFAETALLLAGVSVVVAILAFNPDCLLAIEGLVRELTSASTFEHALMVLQPMLAHPIALATMLMAVAIVIPLVEEAAKSVAPWLMYHRFRTPAEGFWCGALSGAGFALFEGLMASADTSGNWTAIFLIRAWGSMMHVLASGLTGWGIASFRATGRGSRLVGGYALAIAIHALWNASVMGIGYGALRSAFRQAGPDILASTTIAVGGLTLLGLAVMLPTVIWLVNRRLRTSEVSGERPLLPTNGSVLPAPHLEG